MSLTRRAALFGIGGSVLAASRPPPPLTDIDAEIAKRAAEADRRDVKRNADAIRKRCERLVGFMRESWHVQEPHNKYIYSWHHGVIAEHLEAISNRQITRLQINQPPATMKSMMVSVNWQAWEWGPRKLPGTRWLTTSYTETYARRDSRSTRDLILSEWYRELWPEVQLTRDGEMDFENTDRGYRKAMPFGSLTAGRGNRVVIDDPHSVKKVESDSERSETVRLFRESVTSRLNDPLHDAIIVVMHRLHPNDICGEIEKLGLDYVKLVLPMEYEPKTTIVTSYFQDPRTKASELLCPERLPREKVEENKIELGSHAYATQFQQAPSARAGGLFKRHQFHIVDAIPANVNRWVRRWDFAATTPKKKNPDPDWSASVKMGTADFKSVYISDVTHFRDTPKKVRQAISNCASLDGRKVRIIIPQDPGQAGVDQSQSIIGENAGWRIHAVRETGDKGTRAEPLAAQNEAGNVYLLRAPWNETFINELCAFPQGHDDQLDAASGAFNALVGKKKMKIGQETLDKSARPGPPRSGRRLVLGNGKSRTQVWQPYW